MTFLIARIDAALAAAVTGIGNKLCNALDAALAAAITGIGNKLCNALDASLYHDWDLEDTPNDGADLVRQRLTRRNHRRPTVPVGVNLVNTNHGRSAAEESVAKIIADYARKDSTKFWLNTLLALSILFTLVLGTYVLLTFDANIS